MSDLVPDGWLWQPLGDTFDIAIGGTPSRNISAYWDTEKVTNNKWLSIRDLQGKVIIDTSEYLSDEGIKKSNAKLVPKGTVIMSFKLTVGRTAYAGVDLYTNEAIVAFFPKKDVKVNLDYFYQGLQFWNLLENVDQAVKGVTLNKEKINLINGLFPLLPEQQKIARILTSVDDVIEKTQAQIDKLKDLKTGMMQELLTNGIGNNGKPHTQFKDSPVGRIPADWEVKTLVGCSDKMTNGFVGATRGIYQDDGVSYVLCQNVRPNKFIEITYKYVNSEFHLKNIRAELKEGDVLTVQTGAGNGDTCVVPKTFEGANCHALIITRLKKNILNPYFFSEYMNSDLGKNRVSVIATGGAHPHLNTTDLRRELIPIPPIEEQNIIVETLLSIHKRFEMLEMKNVSNKCIKKALMQDLLTGKIRVKVDPTL